MYVCMHIHTYLCITLFPSVISTPEGTNVAITCNINGGLLIWCIYTYLYIIYTYLYEWAQICI